MKRKSLATLHAEMIACRACPRLTAWREQVAREKRRAYAHETYWGRPVPGFGDPKASLLIVGLAPGAHGANRTGRVFTGDRSGDFLYAALHRAGLASQPTSVSATDGLRLTGAFVMSPVRCVPPENHPTLEEQRRCADWMDAELALVPHARVVLALGSIAWSSAWAWSVRTFGGPETKAPKFAHGAEVALAGGRTMVGSYHVSQQNTQTGRLTAAMFDAVVARAIAIGRTR
jgi:uracil-DNA glycosylase family 4